MGVVDHWAWHQHFKGSDTENAAIIRIHNFDSLTVGIQALRDPTPLLEESPKLAAPNQGQTEWPPPDAGRPE